MRIGLVLSLAAGPAAVGAATPAFELYVDTDDASVAPSGALLPPLVVHLGAATDPKACGALCGSWRNASAAAQRCESFTLYGTTAHPILRGKCFGHTSVAWFANPSSGNATSGRMLWPCSGALDCSLNGHCGAGGRCTCSVGWKGLKCGELDVLAVNKSQLGFVPAGSGSSWGGAVTRSHHDTAGWKMYAAKMTNSCGINSWWTNSQIVRAVAPSPFGPYTEGGTAEPMWPAFSTGPGIARDPSGGLVVGLTTGVANGSASAVPYTNCTDGSTPHGHGFPRPQFWTSIAMPLSEGPAETERAGWRMVNVLGHRGWGLGINLAIRSDGTAVAVTRLGYVNSTQYDDPTAWSNPMKDSIPFSSEQKVWQARDGSFHALFHAFNPHWQVSHAFSPDGAAWHYSGGCVNNSVAFSDGTVATMTRRERPHLIFDEDTVNGTRNIIGLINGVVNSADPGEFGDKSYTLIAPVRSSAQWQPALTNYGS